MMRNIPGKFATGLSGWRKAASSIWPRPNDPAIHGFIEVDAGKAVEYVHGLSQTSGVHVTLTHLVVKAVADAFHRHPECNAMIRWGRVYLRDHVDISVLVALDPKDRRRDQGADLTAALVRDADRKSLAEIASELSGGVRSVRQHHDPLLGRVRKLFRHLPPGLLKRALLVSAFLQYQLNLNLSPTRIMPRDPFGSAMVTSLAIFELDGAATPIPPFISLAGIISIGAIKDKPVARQGQVVIRPMMTIGATIDHRVIDGFQGGRLAKVLRSIIQDPETHLGQFDDKGVRIHPPRPTNNYQNVKPLRPGQNGDGERPQP